MRLSLVAVCFSAMLSCTSDNKGKSVSPESADLNHILIDTVRASFPVQVENDKGSVNVIGVRTFKNQTLTNSSFRITLEGIQAYQVSRHIAKATLIDSNKTVLYIDSLNQDHLDGAMISSISFDFIRSNTLHFKALLENPAKNKKVQGRFGLFYRTKKSGTVYGWITEEIN